MEAQAAVGRARLRPPGRSVNMSLILRMRASESAFGDQAGKLQEDLRQQIAGTLVEQADIITADTVAIFPYSGSEQFDSEYCRRIGQLLTQLLAVAVRDGRLDPRGGFVADLYRVLGERSLSVERLFTFAYLTERTALDELALSETIGATSEPWPIVAQLVRRGSFDLLAAYSDRAQLGPEGSSMTDRLTTLYSRVLFDAVLAKEIDRAGRFGHELSIIMFDIDRLSAINQDYGYGVGDKVLERLGILMRTYFRQHDWVARYSEDAIVVLLAQTDPGRVAELAERVRHTVEERLWFTDHRSDRQVPVTVSAAVVNVAVSVGEVIDPERLLAITDNAVEQAKKNGRNRVETVDGSPAIQVRLPSF
jgi:diguanylate cyclase (GGDEF)-like protein